MSTRKTILVHGLLAALPLAMIGFLYAQLAGMWVSSQTLPRTGTNGAVAAATALNASEITSAIAWRLPFTMALFGFVFVAIGESFKAMWVKKTELASSEGRVDLTAMVPGVREVETQRIASEMEHQDTISMNLPHEPIDSESLFEVEVGAAAGGIGASNLHN